MGLNVSVETNFKVAQKRMRKMGIAFSSQEYLKWIKNDAVRWVADNFKSEGGKSEQRRWKPLSASTLAARRGSSSRILQDTGRLKQSFTAKVFKSGGFVRVGSNDIRAASHNFGRGSIPKRQIIPTVKQAKMIGITTLARYTRKLVKDFNRG